MTGQTAVLSCPQPGRSRPSLRLTLLHSKNRNMAVLIKALLDELLGVSSRTEERNYQHGQCGACLSSSR